MCFVESFVLLLMLLVGVDGVDVLRVVLRLRVQPDGGTEQMGDLRRLRP